MRGVVPLALLVLLGGAAAHAQQLGNRSGPLRDDAAAVELPPDAAAAADETPDADGDGPPESMKPGTAASDGAAEPAEPAEPADTAEPAPDAPPPPPDLPAGKQAPVDAPPDGAPSPATRAASSPAPSGSPTVAVAPGLVLPGLASMSQTRDRPLFAPSRRPPPPPPEVAEAEPEPDRPQAPPEPPPFDLAGIVVGGESGFALLRNHETEKIEHAKRGDVLAGWTVSEIGQRHVVVSRDDRTVRLALFEVKGGSMAHPQAAVEDEDSAEDSEDGFLARERQRRLAERRARAAAARRAIADGEDDGEKSGGSRALAQRRALERQRARAARPGTYNADD